MDTTKTKRIRFIRTLSTTRGCFQRGKSYDLDAADADQFLREENATLDATTPATQSEPGSGGDNRTNPDGSGAADEFFGRPIIAFTGMTDQQIMQLPKIGKAGLKKIRDAQAAAQHKLDDDIAAKAHADAEPAAAQAAIDAENAKTPTDLNPLP